MTVEVNDTVERYTISGTGPYPFSFRIFDDEEIAVVVDTGDLDPVPLTISTHYTVDGVNDVSGGSITLASDAATAYAGSMLEIRSNTTEYQPTSIRNQGAFLPSIHEDAFDRLARQLQDLSRRVDRKFGYPDNVLLNGEMSSRSAWAGKYPFVNEDGEIEPAAVIAPTTLTQSLIGQLFYPRTSAEIAAGVTPTNYAYPPGDVRRYGFSGDAGVTDNTTALTNALAANAGYVPVVVPNMGAYAKFTGRIVAPANSTLVLQDGAELRWTATAATGTSFLGSATRPGIEVTGDNFRLEGRGIIRGPTSASYVSNEVAIFGKGTSSASRKSGFVVDGEIEFLNWGAYGIALQYVNDVRVSRTKIHDVGYSGMAFLSCTHGRVMFNDVSSITPGTSGNAYGISCTHDSTGYNADSEVLAGRQRTATNPFCIDFHVCHNEVSDIPVWRAIDFHGGFECKANHNTIYNTKYPIGMSSSSGDAINYAGQNNEVNYNTIASTRRDGSATTVATLDGTAILINGGSSAQHINPQCVGNVIDGYGLNSASSGSIEATQVRNANITYNRLRNWQRYGIFSNEGDGTIAGNIFDAVANASNSRCIWNDSSTYGWTIEHNRHEAHGGTVAAEGLRITSSNPRCVVGSNYFEQATLPYVNADGGHVLARRMFAATIASRRTVTYSASITIDAQEGNTFVITANNGTAFAINAPTNPQDGQRITITIRNTSGGALGAITWNAVFKMAAYTAAATGNNRSAWFFYDGTNWIMEGQSAADVPN